jgi:RNA polymerase sigma factor (sigma-70 family)
MDRSLAQELVQPQSMVLNAPYAPSTAAEALRLYGAWLRAVAVARLKTTQGADDVMQEVAAAAVRNWATLQSAQNAKPWLYRLTVRAALMHRRTLGRARKRIAQATEVHVIRHGRTGAAGAEPLAALLARERCDLLRHAMIRLPSRDAELLMMKHVDDCSYAEIASRLGVSVSVVEMRLFRARQKLRQMLSRHEAS